jgi:CRISPR-associated protein Csm1
MDLPPSNLATLHILQQAIAALLKWANIPHPSTCPIPEPIAELKPAIDKALQLLGWNDQPTLGALELLFDRVQLTDRQFNPTHYSPLQAIADQNPLTPYPLRQAPTEEDKAKFCQSLQSAVQLLPDNWNNLAFLTVFLEKFAHCVSFGSPNIALLDVARTTGAIAAALVSNPQAEELTLVGANLSGIQNFIYTISSDGALKSLRARSFYLELVTEEVAQQLLKQLNLPRTNIIYAGGGNLFLIAPQPDQLQQIRQTLNRWLYKSFQGKIFLSLDAHSFKPETVTTPQFRTCWNELIKKLSQQKTTKFRDLIDDILQPKPSYEACRVCHRDDVEQLGLLNGEGSVPACKDCQKMFQLGSKLFKVDSMVRSHQPNPKALDSIAFQFQDSSPVYYHLFSSDQPITDSPETVFLINNWNLEDYQFRHFHGKATSLLLGNYGQTNENGFLSASDFAEQSAGIDRVGYLRMDVDRLGQIFANGLGNDYSLPRLAGLSRQMSYFFKTYLNELAKHRSHNFLNHPEFHNLTSGDRRNLLFIYAGGDDVFICGAWNEVTEFAFDIYQSFRAYTGNNPDITLSGGITLETTKFPLYQAAALSGEAEHSAKANGRDSLCVFDQTFKWDNWLGIPNLPDNNDRKYLESEEKPTLLGVLPFVTRLIDPAHFAGAYPKSFIRNLLVVAELREQKIAEAEVEQPYQQQAITYYLHLPKLAYAFSRLPPHLRNDPKFDPIRRSLLSPLNSPYFRAIATWTDLLTRSSNP